jgi:hypothetical protein
VCEKVEKRVRERERLERSGKGEGGGRGVEELVHTLLSLSLSLSLFPFSSSCVSCLRIVVNDILSHILGVRGDIVSSLVSDVGITRKGFFFFFPFLFSAVRLFYIRTPFGVRRKKRKHPFGEGARWD